jgi:membrane associated rhomboid family serine protease
VTWTTPLILMATVVIVSVAGFFAAPVRSKLILVPFLVAKKGQIHRLLTAGWLHADAQHLIFNLITLYFFANVAASVLGDVKFLALYVSAVVVSHVPTTLLHMKDPRYASLGASGAVSAVMLSAILLRPTMRVGIAFLPFAVPGMIYAVVYLIYSAIQAWRAQGRINHEAHFAGAIYGAAFTWVLEPERVSRALRELF